MLLGAVGQLQFEVVQHRLKGEYDADIRLECSQYVGARWITADTGPQELRGLHRRLPDAHGAGRGRHAGLPDHLALRRAAGAGAFPEDPFPPAARTRPHATPLLDSTGARKDRFSFITTASGADSLATGEAVGYGADWRLDSARRVRVGQVTPGSPAAQAGLARGGVVEGILNAGGSFFPTTNGALLTVRYRASLTSAEQIISMTATPVQDDPVPLVRVVSSGAGRQAGYVLFNAHIRGAQDKLIDAMHTLQGSPIDAVVLDLRYNGGGFLYTALALASMLAPPAAEKKIFERLQFNDKRASETEESTFSFSSQLQFSDGRYAEGTVLPRLNLPRVYVLTSASTCSASESIVNSLRGVDVEVVLIGANTCGKPYGFSRQDNCGLSYFPIEFQGTNQKGFGDYAGGFAPQCAATDDFDRALGDTGEGMLATALAHLDGKGCTTRAQSVRRDLLAAPDEALARSVADRPQRPGRLWAPSQAGAGLTR
jgi:carboxyl-terminal processing protease